MLLIQNGWKFPYIVIPKWMIISSRTKLSNLGWLWSSWIISFFGCFLSSLSGWSLFDTISIHCWMFLVISFWMWLYFAIIIQYWMFFVVVFFAIVLWVNLFPLSSNTGCLSSCIYTYYSHKRGSLWNVGLPPNMSNFGLYCIAGILAIWHLRLAYIHMVIPY